MTYTPRKCSKRWLDGDCPQGVGMYGERRAYEIAAYRYRCKHQYAKWSSLPEAVKRCVRADLA